jgi:hypothetical protein
VAKEGGATEVAPAVPTEHLEGACESGRRKRGRAPWHRHRTPCCAHKLARNTSTGVALQDHTRVSPAHASQTLSGPSPNHCAFHANLPSPELPWPVNNQGCLWVAREILALHSTQGRQE